MNILTFTGLFPNNVFPNQGVFIKERIHALSKLDNVSIKVVAPVPYCPPFIGGRWAAYRRIAKAEILDGLDVTHPRYLMTPKVGMSSYGVLLYLSVLPHVKRLQREFDFHLIDAHFLYPDGFAAVLLGRRFNKPVVVTARGSDVNRYQQFPIVRHLLRYTLDRAHAVVSVSGALKEAIMDLGVPAHRVTVVPNGVDKHKFFPLPKLEARKSLGLPTEGAIVLFVGNLTENKGCGLIMRAIKILHERGLSQNLTFVIVGKGPVRAELDRLVTSLMLIPHVRFVGDVPHHQLASWYSAADVLCLASEKEGWPNVLMESIACGTPVLATAVGGIPEIVSSENVGLLTARNEHAIAHGVVRVLSRKWDRNLMAEYKDQHSWERTAVAISEVFQNLCGHTSVEACVPALANRTDGSLIDA